ncbi:MAG: cysteine desulfurase-like protein [Actinomycetales bacterium]
MAYDVDAVRAHFPSLQSGVAHFDGPGGSQTPDVVATAVAGTLTSSIANRGDVTQAERTADAVVLAARAAMADLVGGDPRGVVFGRSMTQLTYDVSRTLAKAWGPGDEVVVSRLDHDANVRPWVQAAEAVGATVRWAEFDLATTELTVDAVREVLSPSTMLVALTGASNLLGSRPDIAAIAAAVRKTGALLYVDGVHLTPHAAVDVAALGADFYACSPYKFLGPHLGAVVARPQLWETLHPDKLAPSTDAVPERFELGTLPYELLAGVTAAVEFHASFGDLPDSAPRRDRVLAGLAALEAHEDALRKRLDDGLAGIRGVTVLSRAADRTPTVLMTFDDREAEAAYRFLAQRGVNAPAGTFYAYEPALALGLGEVGGLRAGLAPYSTEDDVERLLEGLEEFMAG